MVKSGIGLNGIGEAKIPVGQSSVGILHMDGVTAGAVENISCLYPVITGLIHHNGIGGGAGGPEVGCVARTRMNRIRTKTVGDGGVGAECHRTAQSVHEVFFN
ncbi:hypothetical protein SDC9_91399 [bioreactor metagenome]|uniref:Uncharacterized protein n=1 Tax=bioreactor metagenome TaxID=1076179 RepID=A0A644ZWD1_9ZZZZ